jgi:hypothetical protein
MNKGAPTLMPLTLPSFTSMQVSAMSGPRRMIPGNRNDGCTVLSILTQMAALLANHLAKLSLACMGAPVWECLLQDQHAKGKYKPIGNLRLLVVDIFGFCES